MKKLIILEILSYTLLALELTHHIKILTSLAQYIEITSFLLKKNPTSLTYSN